MSGLTSIILLVAALSAQPMTLEAERGEGIVTVRFEVLDPLPERAETALTTGAEVRIQYPLRVYARRRMWWDNKIWKGVAETAVTFDAITGRYLCRLIVNGETTVSQEVDSVEVARSWLVAPPPVDLPIPPARQNAHLRVTVRAVYSRGTTWLVFPSTTGIDWMEVRLEPPPTDE